MSPNHIDVTPVQGPVRRVLPVYGGRVAPVVPRHRVDPAGSRVDSRGSRSENQDVDAEDAAKRRGPPAGGGDFGGAVELPAAPTGYRSSVVTLGIGEPTQDSDSAVGSVTLTVNGEETGAVAEVPEAAAFLAFDPDRFLLSVDQSTSGATVTPSFSVGAGTITLLESFSQQNLYEVTVSSYVAGSFTISIAVSDPGSPLEPSCLLYPVKGQIIQHAQTGLAVFASDSNIGFGAVGDEPTPPAGWTSYDVIVNGSNELDTYYLDSPSDATEQQEFLFGGVLCELGP